MKISLGTEGPTDSCLILHNGIKTKQYGIESIAWQLLNIYWNVTIQHGHIPDELGGWIWDNRDCDIF